MKACFAAVALTAACLAAATPAAAARFVFDVTIDLRSTSGGGGGPVAYTFQQTFIGANPYSTYDLVSIPANDIYPSYSKVDTSLGYSPMSVSDTPFDADVRSVAGSLPLAYAGGYLYGSAKSEENSGVYLGETSYGAGEGASYSSSTCVDQFVSCQELNAGWRTAIIYPGDGADQPMGGHVAKMTVQQIIAALSGRDLIYSSLGSYRLDTYTRSLVPDVDDPSIIRFTEDQATVENYIEYGGVARLNAALTVVPEPGTWALMLTGFGGLGAMLRRRRRTGARAA